MDSVQIKTLLDNLPVPEVEQSLATFLAPLTTLLPDRRLQRVVPLAVRGIIAGETPVITAMVHSVTRTDTAPWPAATRISRCRDNPRVPPRRLTTGLSHLARTTVAQEQPPYLVIAIDPVTCEQPDTVALEGGSTVRKSTPPARRGQARLTRGYPASPATVVNTRIPATSYATWCSSHVGFRSENWEIKRALRMRRAGFPAHPLRLVGDAGLDDQTSLQWMAEGPGQFVIRASQLARVVEVHTPRLNRWATEHLQALVATVPFAATWQVAFTQAGDTRQALVQVGWLSMRIPETPQALWAVVAEDYAAENQAVRTVVSKTTVAVAVEADAQAGYEDWRVRGRIEHGYRFDQEQGLDVEDMRGQPLARMRC